MDDFDKEGTLVLTTPVKKPDKPQPDGEACIILLHPPGPDIGRRTPLGKSIYQVGREPTFDLVLSRDSVSRQHAELRCNANGEWRVVDLGSTNGTFVNEARVREKKLVDGDQIRFGDIIFKFLSGANVENAYHEEIFKMTIMDGLTQVHNKRYLLDFLERELAAAHRHETPLSLVLFDIDHFKMINDNRGHLCGDEVLKQLTARIKPRIRREDLFARYGGEEFAAVLGHTDKLGAITFAEQLRTIVADRPFEFAGEEFSVTVSLGVACVHRAPELGVEDMIRLADQNLYRAKNAGRNLVVPGLDDPQASG